MRGEPKSVFARAIVRTSSANSELTGGQPIARGVTSRSRKRGSLAGASESRSGGERHGVRRATQLIGRRATPRRDDRGARIAGASIGGEAGRVVVAAPDFRTQGQCGF